jgi:hypothetical protein
MINFAHGEVFMAGAFTAFFVADAFGRSGFLNEQPILAILILILVTAGIANAQSCNGLPCGNLPWTIPQYPTLNSPTPIPSVAATATPTPVLTATSTPIPASPTANLSGIGDGSDNVLSLLTATAIGVDINGTPYTTDFTGLAQDSELFISYAKAVSAADFGVLTPMIQFTVFAMVFTLVVKLSELAIPLAALAFGALRKIAQTILDFIPF